MRFLWAEDFDSDSQDKKSKESKWDAYFQLEGKYINFQSLEEVLNFLEEPSNWGLFDAVLIDIRFRISRELTGDAIYAKYFSNFLKKEKYDKYTETIGGDPDSASAGILLFLALVHRYNYSQGRIAFISANVDGSGNRLSSLKKMREYLCKAGYELLTTEDIDNFSLLSEQLAETYDDVRKKAEPGQYNHMPEEMDFPITDEIDWEGIKRHPEKRNRLLEKLDGLENFLQRPISEGNTGGLKYDSVKADFDKVGLLVPRAFEKPDGSEQLDRSWQFKLWKDCGLLTEYYQLRSLIIPVCLELEKAIKEKGNQIFQPYIGIFSPDQNEDVKNELLSMLTNIIELFPPNVWTQNNTSLYTRVLKECVNLCDKKTDTKTCRAVLKIARNWLAHQGIEGVEAFDVAFIFHVMVHTFFDMTQKSRYREWDTLLMESFCTQGEPVKDKTAIIARYENKAREVHKNSYNKFVDSIPGISTTEREKIRKTGYPSEKQKKYSFNIKASLFDTVSALGNSYSPVKDSVSMRELYLLFLGNRKNDSYGWEPGLEQELLRRLAEK